MSNDNSKIVKNIQKKKINHYTLEDCNKELARLENQAGLSPAGNQTSSRYYKCVMAQKKLLMS